MNPEFDRGTHCDWCELPLSQHSTQEIQGCIQAEAHLKARLSVNDGRPEQEDEMRVALAQDLLLRESQEVVLGVVEATLRHDPSASDLDASRLVEFAFLQAQHRFRHDHEDEDRERRRQIWRERNVRGWEGPFLAREDITAIYDEVDAEVALARRLLCEGQTTDEIVRTLVAMRTHHSPSDEGLARASVETARAQMREAADDGGGDDGP